MFASRIRSFVTAFKTTVQPRKRRPVRKTLGLELLEPPVVPTTFTWTGAGANANWSTAANWQGNAAPTIGAILVFGASEARLTNVDDIPGLSLGEITLAGGYSISGDAITLTGAGSSISFGNGQDPSETAIDNQAGTNSLNNPITLGADVIFAEEAGQLNMGGVITGAANLAENGTGTLFLGAAETYTGYTYLGSGTIEIGVANALPIATTLVYGQATVYAPQTVDLNGFDQTLAGTSQDTSTDDPAITDSGAAATITINVSTSYGSGLFRGPLTLVKTGSANLELPAGDSYTGGTVVNDGIIRILTDSGLGGVPATPTPGSLTLNGGTLTDSQTAPPLSLNANRGISVGPSGGTIVASGSAFSVDGIIAGTGELAIPGPHTTTLGGGENINLTGTTAGTGYLQIEAEAAVSLGAAATLNVTLGYTPMVGDSYTLIHDDGGSVSGTFAGLAEGATLSVAGSTFQITYKGGTGNDVVLTCLTTPICTWTGGGANANWSTAANWQAGLAPTTGDTLVFGASEARLTNVDNIAGLSVAQIQVAGGYSISGDALTLTGTSGTGIDNVSGTNTINDPIALGTSLVFTGAGQLNLGGVISGSAGLTLRVNTILGAANTYTGSTTVGSGSTVSISADDNLGVDPATATAGSLIFSGGTLAATDSFTINANRGLSFQGSGTTATIDVAGGSTLTYNGIATLGAAFDKTDSGTLIFGGHNTYTGATTVVAGTFLVNGSQASSKVTVDSGAVLGGTGGTIGSLTVTAGAVSPGAASAATGILNSGNVSFTCSRGVQRQSQWHDGWHQLRSAQRRRHCEPRNDHRLECLAGLHSLRRRLLHHHRQRRSRRGRRHLCRTSARRDV